MKKMFYFLFCLMTVLSFTSCSDDDDEGGYKIYPVQVQLVYPQDAGVSAVEAVQVALKNTVSGTVFNGSTNETGLASFEVPEGLYEASASDKRVVGAKVLLFNGLNTNVAVNGQTTTVNLPLEVSMGGSVVIKELYIGGCPGDNGAKPFQRDQYVILYNNSSETIDITDFAFAAVNPYNSHAANKDYENGELVYAKDKVIPAGNAVWYFTDKVELASGEEVVVAFNSGVNHTPTYTQSVDLSKSEYYCMYDTEDFDNPNYYPAPSEAIPTSHHLKTYKLKGVTSNAWTISNMSPAFFVFRPEGTDLKSFVENPANLNQYMGSDKQTRAMVPDAWVVDGIEVFKEDAAENQKRLLNSVDAGYVMLTNKLGHTLYRNVDKEATEALESNKGKLVYNYALGVGESTDPSGIDAEASMKAGARIIYMDTNNSTNDFHQRSKASLRN